VDNAKEKRKKEEKRDNGNYKSKINAKQGRINAKRAW
jgi:hypothetical protein